MNRIEETIKSCLKNNKKVLACFITAGFPTIDATPQLVQEIEKAGADIVELGMPFSDPLADGPVIQHSSQIALEQGITLDKIFSHIEMIRQQSNIPIVLMGYLNPILRYSADRFFHTAVSIGVDGIILPEVPYEECGRYKTMIESEGLANILLIAPTTPAKRIIEIDKASSGFLYCVSTTGVTGANVKSSSIDYIKRVKQLAKKNPVLVGFGIKTPEDAKAMSKESDGVIVGSAIINKILEGMSFEQVGQYIKQLKEAM